MNRNWTVLVVCLIGACKMGPENLQGKRFDANSGYCRQLWREATLAYPSEPLTPPARAISTNPRPIEPAFVNQVQRDSNMRAYAMDCESPTAYNLRVQEEQ